MNSRSSRNACTVGEIDGDMEPLVLSEEVGVVVEVGEIEELRVALGVMLGEDSEAQQLHSITTALCI